MFLLYIITLLKGSGSHTEARVVGYRRIDGKTSNCRGVIQRGSRFEFLQFTDSPVYRAIFHFIDTP